jgi:CubicO group peptidase (beta-lactamase class C family)
VKRLCILLVSLCACARTTTLPDDPRKATLDRYFDARTELGQWSGAALVAVGDRVILRRADGYADVEHRIAYRPDTAQPVASISKMFTALTALKLRDRGALSLDDSVCKYLDDCPEAWRPVTIAHLIHHRSGIPDYEERLEIGSDAYMALMTRPDAPAKILAAAKTRPLDFAPGTKFHYSNTGYVVLAHALEKASGEHFATLVSEAVLEPAGMAHSGRAGTVGYTYGDLGWAKLLHGVSLTDGHLRAVPSLTLTGPQGDAWLSTTVDDLLAFSRHMETSPLAAEIATAEDGYGAGWTVDRAFDRRRMHHNGIVPGFVSDFIRFPDDRITIVLLSNVDRVRLSRIARDVSAIVLGQPYDLPVRGDVVELAPEQFGALAGTYRLDDGRTLEIRKDPDLLAAELKGQFTAGLIPLSPTEFYVPLADGRAIFTMGGDGRATSVNLRFNGTDQIARKGGRRRV